MVPCCQRQRRCSHVSRAVSLSSVALTSSNVVMLFRQHVPRLSKYFILCLPLALISSISPVTTSFSNPFLLITCPKNSSCRLRSVCNNGRPTDVVCHYFLIAFLFCPRDCQHPSQKPAHLCCLQFLVQHFCQLVFNQSFNAVFSLR